MEEKRQRGRPPINGNYCKAINEKVRDVIWHNEISMKTLARNNVAYEVLKFLEKNGGEERWPILCPSERSSRKWKVRVLVKLANFQEYRDFLVLCDKVEEGLRNGVTVVEMEKRLMDLKRSLV